MNITIPNVDDAIIQRLKQLAWQEGISFEDSLRRLLAEAAYQRNARARQFEAPARRLKLPA